uniref:RNA_pol_Rbc25 domain-containing protein n=1 Tax=Meloidogyne hapla TaxID=6305 RepID=A0A1I8BAI5_MELHA
MFVLTTISHIVEIAPNVLGKDFVSTLVEKINKQFANYPGNASTHTPIVFRYVVFQPFINEILEGVISQSNRDGLTLTLHFFNDIKVLPDKLPDVSKLFKIVSVKYHSLKPGTSGDSTSVMSIEASMIDMGLGCVDWWDPAVSDEVKQEMNENEEQIES